MTPLLGLTALVWAASDGERIPRDAPIPPPVAALARGQGNPVWGPGRPISLFALGDEVIAFQVVVEGPAEDVSVEVRGLDGSVRVDRFVEYFLDVRRSTTRGSDGTLGWHAGSGPPGDELVGWLPDPLIPVEIAPPWAPWPLELTAGRNGVVWIDLTVPRDLGPRHLHGVVVVRARDRLLATLPLELEILPAVLPRWPVRTWLFYERSGLRDRVGDLAAAETQLLTLLHDHRLSGFASVGSVDDVGGTVRALDGSLYTRPPGGRGPANGPGDDLVVLGTYGTLGDPTASGLNKVEAMADELAGHGVFERAEVVLYADDENCASPRGAGWRALLGTSTNPNARRVRVGWACSDDPAGQPVDVPMVLASDYDSARAIAARASGKETWIYNGVRPATGSLLTDAPAVDPRTFGWIASLADVSRWFVWNSTAWGDSNPGGHGPFDPFATAVTEHDDRDGSVLMGDGLLLYPGRQLGTFAAHSLGFSGVIPSIRLKNLRRGIEDAGYYQLARGAARDEAEAIARALFPRILAEARPGDPPAWSAREAPFFEARLALSRLLATGADPGPSRVAGAGPRPTSFHLRRRYIAAVVAALAVAWIVRRRHRRLTA